jgi:hypothetical protein
MALTNDDNGDELEESKESAEAAFDPMAEPVVLASVASIAFSWYLYYIKEDETHGLFVGLWAPTLLGAANYFKNLRVAEKLDAGLSFR